MLTILVSIALLTLQLPSVLGSEALSFHVEDIVEVNAADQVVLVGPAVSAETPTYTNASALMAPIYEIDCSSATGYPEICQNWCYYVFCKQKGVDASSPAWIVTVDRNANNRAKGECGKYKPSPNKCSTKVDRMYSPWPANPVPDMDCDEQPKNTNSEGGAGAATRCIIKYDNRSEGADWRNFINDKSAYINNGMKVVVRLVNHGGAGRCASLVNTGSTVCPPPASPSDPFVKMDAIRQQ